MHVLANEPLQQRNTLSLACQASAYVRVSSEQVLMQALAWAAEQGKKIVTLGEGSNVVLAADLDALVVQQAQCGIEILEQDDDKVQLRIAAGENWHSLVEWTLARHYYGLENLALIPGTVRAAPIQNIGAYGVELASFVQRVWGVTIENKQPFTLDAKECEFGYRDSVFKRALRDKVIITSVELRLSKKPQLQLGYPALKDYLQSHSIDAPTPRAVFEAVVQIRQSRLPDPASLPNAGSFFKNPVIKQAQFDALLAIAPTMPGYPQPNGLVKLPAAWLIDQCGWKGKRRGGFGVHPEHALVLVNYGGDEGAELLQLAQDISQSVKETYGIQLEIEPRVYGLE